MTSALAALLRSRQRVLGPSPLEQEALVYLAFKRKRLTPASERGYRSVLCEFARFYPEHELARFEPPDGTVLLEDFLTLRWGNAAPRTYNKSFSVLHDFVKWQIARGRLLRDPMLSLEKARPRAIDHRTYSKAQREQLLAANPHPRDQVALRLLLDYGIRKGALRNVRLEHFDHGRRRLVIFTKGGKIQTIPIPDPAVWRNLHEIGGEPQHYLLPRQKIRKRISPDRTVFAEISELVGDLGQLVDAIGDPACLTEKERFAELVDEAFAVLAGMAESASVQVRRWVDEPLGEHGAHLYWYRWLARAGIVERGTTAGSRMHDARHTAGQRMLEATGNLVAAQRLLGHASSATTSAHYVGWDDDQLDGSLRRALGLPTLAEELQARAAEVAEQGAFQ